MRNIFKLSVLALFAVSFAASIVQDPIHTEVKGQFDLFSSVLAVPMVERRHSCGGPIMEFTDAIC
jgi:hypothetical protein